MKKHDEGYALVLVLVTMVVLGIAATALMSIGLRNLKAQQAVGERMVNKYAAQGEIEMAIALLSQPYEVEKEVQTDSGASEEDIKKELESRLIAYISDWINEKCGKTPDEVRLTLDGEKYQYSCIIALNAAKESTSIDCQLQLTGTVVEEADAYGKAVCKIEPDEPVYKSFVISHNTEGGGS